ncbi:hypothetical protein ABC304_00270 [Microbacterium sp. 1P10UB]|jgi:hypothetical protein|uniref:Uncharacterized protein n=4 Tax=Bacteria TaxID=2 RepID=A0A7W7FH40_9MICO|nr:MULTISPECIES: hypothetical protein [Micrococcales]EIC07816.1 hypothetical protein OR221_2137 [Microbacterium laevaniformans OR221]MAL55592.1 hypothetical protein [Brevundimonas sp.]MEC8761381.1 hypothetical protein [Actinomycetota bacterium]KYJ97214.1 hypothetical protein AUV07_02450 [Microbacterium sp. CH1]MAL55630.1 hypothetical protein [Brevundimonas sp.]|tara:strand:+ start:4232 stop:5116 length:885 start_codon:yes stop_codon:yes gene_type:complete
MRTHTCPPDHKHGLTSTCYVVHLCGCRACMDGNARRRRDRYRLLAYGRYQDAHQPIEPIRQHLQALVDTGMIPERIAISAGVGGATVRRLLNSETARFVTGATARKLLAVTPDSSTLAAQGRVNGRGTRRRLQALAAIGWNHHEIARRLGYPRWKVNKALEGAYVDIRVHDDIAALYDELWDQQPPTHTRAQRVGRSYALTVARRHGWLPPLAWDDIDTDPAPPTAGQEPLLDEIAIELALAGQNVRLTRDERLEATRRGTERGLSLTQLSDLLGVDVRTIDRDRDDLGLRQAA